MAVQQMDERTVEQPVRIDSFGLGLAVFLELVPKWTWCRLARPSRLSNAVTADGEQHPKQGHREKKKKREEEVIEWS